MPAFLILIGLSFLLAHFNVISENLNAIIWPSLIVLLGLSKLTGGSCKCYMRQG